MNRMCPTVDDTQRENKESLMLATDIMSSSTQQTLFLVEECVGKRLLTQSLKSAALSVHFFLVLSFDS